MKIGSTVIHCHDFDRTVAFWQAALHYVPREPAKDGWVVLRDPEAQTTEVVWICWAKAMTPPDDLVSAGTKGGTLCPNSTTNPKWPMARMKSSSSATTNW